MMLGNDFFSRSFVFHASNQAVEVVCRAIEPEQKNTTVKSLAGIGR